MPKINTLHDLSLSEGEGDCVRLASCGMLPNQTGSARVDRELALQTAGIDEAAGGQA
jgi:hypothetical protein